MILSCLYCFAVIVFDAKMSVHYQFKSASKKWDTITFDSAVISVLDLKRAIVTQQKMDKAAADFDLLITNAQTGERAYIYTKPYFHSISYYLQALF